MRNTRQRRLASSLLLALPVAGIAATALTSRAMAQSSTPVFASGNVVVAVEGCGVQGGTCTAVPNGNGNGAGNSSNGGYGDNQGAPLTLFQFAPNGTTSAAYVNSLVLPQTQTNANLPVSGEYGSSSEGTLQLSGGGQYLTIGGYGINAATFDATPTAYGAAPSNALAQSGSLTGQSYTPVARVAALIDPYGNVNSSSAYLNIFNTNNPRSVYTQDGVSIYLSGQGSGTDATGGVFFAPLFATSTAPTAITGLDTSSNTISQDTRTVQIYNGTLYVSLDSKAGSGSARSYLGTLGKPPATSLYNSNGGPTQVAFANNAASPVATTSTGKLVLTASETNGINLSGQTINLSASNYFFASPSVLYIADSGAPKQNSASTLLGDGGLQKWVNTKADGSGTFLLQYTLSAGLNLVANTAGTGTSGLYALTGTVSGANVYLYATNYTLTDLDPTYLYGFTDVLASTTKPSTSFTLLATAPSDSNFKGVSMAPVLAAGSATITSTPSGLKITTAGTGCMAGTYVTPFTVTFTPGSTCQLSTTATQTSGSSTYTFAHWQDGTTNTSDVVSAPAGSAIFTATFADSTTTAVTSATPNSVTIGDITTLKATVADNAVPANSPAGNVTFSTTVNGTKYPAGTAAVTGGTATLSYTAAHAGANTITASFVPTSSSSFAASADATGQPLTVAKGALVENDGFNYTNNQGDNTILSVVVGYPGPVAPTGAISLTVNGSNMGLGTASCVYKINHLNCSYPFSVYLAPGTYPINYTQAGDANYTTVSGSDTLVVNAPVNASQTAQGKARGTSIRVAGGAPAASSKTLARK